MLVSFSCYHCNAVLSIPEEQSGISGPCPYCGTVVTSPSPKLHPEPELSAEFPVVPQSARKDPATSEAAGRQPAANKDSSTTVGLKKMSEEQTVLPFRRLFLVGSRPA